MNILFLGHSGFAVDTGNHVLLFDYCPRRHKQTADALLSAFLRGRKPLIFVSHAHRDHYMEEIYQMNGAGIWVGCGVPVQHGAISMQGGDRYENDTLSVQAFPSTDEGVAFLVAVDGLRIFHAGDLNWWHWPDEPDPWNPDMERQFLACTESLLKEPIDLAFLCADPRQRESWLLGFDYLMRHGTIALAVPMHFWNQRSAPEKVRNAEICRPYRDRICLLSTPGDTLTQ